MKTTNFIEEVAVLKSILDKTQLEVAIKWGGEVYTLNGKTVVSYGAFKHHFCLWFHHGVFLSDPYGVLINANEEKTKALRQWRFTAMDQIDEKKILEYVTEAIANEENGRSWKPQKSEMPPMPTILLEAFAADSSFEHAFKSLTPYKQKEYLEHFTSAKQEKTQLSRLEKCIPQILDGIGLNDKYKKC